MSMSRQLMTNRYFISGTPGKLRNGTPKIDRWIDVLNENVDRGADSP